MKQAGTGQTSPRRTAVPNRAPRTAVGLKLLYGGLLGLTLWLLVHNLDGRLLWGDEAETATLAKNVLRYGVPKTYDGVNRLTLFGAERDANRQEVWTWSPWLQQYVAAGAYGCFGPTTWASRIAFALIAWSSLVLLAWVAYRIYRRHAIALSVLALVGTSEVFLLHARQCRYYSISVLSEVLFLYGLYQLLARNPRGAWKLAAALILQFYSNYIIAVANLPVLLPLAWTLFRRDPRSVLPVGLAVGGFGLAALPWLWYAKTWQQSGALDSRYPAYKFWYYLPEFHFHFVPWVFLLLPLGGWLLARRNRAKPVAEKAALPSGDSAPGPAADAQKAIRLFEWHLGCLMGLYLAVIVIPPGTFLRYLLPLLPVGCLLAAAWLFRYIRWPVAAAGLVLLQCACNGLALGTAYPWKGQHAFRWPTLTLAGSLTRPYTDRFADVLAFLKQEAQPGQTVAVFDPEFPLKFYSGLRVLDARFEVLTEPLPEWILSESASGLVMQHPLELPGVLAPHYESIRIRVHDSVRRGVLPDPDWYQYEMASNTVPYLIYRKRTPQ